MHTAEVFTTGASGVSHLVMRNVDRRLFLRLAIPGVVGGVIGVILGGAIGMIATASFDAFVWPPLSAVLLALVFSLATGVFFGAYPASKAAKMQPIEALRYE